MNRLFIVDTPFQVFNCLNYVSNTQKEGVVTDICVINQFKIADKLYTNLCKTGLFNNLALLEREKARNIKNGTLRRVKVALDFIFTRSCIKSHYAKGTVIMDKNHYDEIYFSCTTHIVSAFIKLNMKADINLLDDGTGSYNGDATKTSNAKYEKLMNIVSNGATSKRASRLYVNNVALCHSVAADQILPMPALTEKFATLANEVFEYDNNGPEKSKKFVFLTQPCDDGVAEDLKKVLEVLKDYKDESYVRMHPRDRRFEPYQEFYLDKAEQLWELKCAQPQMQNNILISLYSTAQFNPNMLFGIEPILVFVFNLCSDVAETTKNSWTNFINEFAKNYTHPERIYMPKTIDEFREIIEKYK